jgi:hypothetical protein
MIPNSSMVMTHETDRFLSSACAAQCVLIDRDFDRARPEKVQKGGKGEGESEFLFFFFFNSRNSLRYYAVIVRKSMP